MAKKVKHSDLIESGIFEKDLPAIKAQIDALDLLEKKYKDVLVTTTKLNAKNVATKKDIDQFVSSTNKSRESVEGLNAVQKKKIKTLEALSTLQSKEGRQLEKTKLQLQKVRQETKRSLKETNALNSSYEKSVARLQRLGKQLKDVAFKEGVNSKATKRLAKDYNLLRTKIHGAEKVAGQFQRNVGNYPSVVGKAAGALRSFGLAMGGVSLLRNTFNIVKDFGQAQANLSAILADATIPQLKALEATSIKLGSTTKFTATQVSELQTEFAKLGFSVSQIQDATEATLQLAAATGTDLAEAAAVTGATLGGFGLDAAETQRVVDVMAKSFASSALDMEKFKESMKTAAPAAKAVGLTVEETTASLGTLASAGISGSKAGNNLKTSLINLNKAGLTLDEGLEKVANSENKLGAATKLVGKNAAASFLVLSEGAEATKELTISLENAGGAAKEAADKQLNTLGGAVELLKSAWEGFVLSLEQGTGAFSGLKDILFFVAENLTTIIKLVAAMAVGFGVYKLINKTTKAFKGLSLAMKVNPIGLVLTALATLITSYQLFAETLTDAEFAQNNYNKAAEEGAKIEKESIAESQKDFQNKFRDIQRLAKLEGKTVEEVREAKKKAAREEAQAIEKRIRFLREEQESKTFDAEIALENAEQAHEAAVEAARVRGGGLASQNNDASNAAKEIIATKTKLSQISGFNEAAIKEQKARLVGLNELFNDLIANEVEGEREKNEEISKEREKARADKTKELGLYLRRLEDLQDAAIVSSFKREQQQINRKFDRDIAAIKGRSQVEIDLKLALEAARQKSLIELREKFDTTEENQRKNDDEKKLEHQKEQNDEALQIDLDYFDSVLDAKTKQLDIIAKTEEVAASEYLNAELDKLIAEVKLLELYGKDTTAKRKEITDKKHQIHLANIDEELKAEEEAAEAAKKLLDERLDFALTAAEALNEILKKKSDERLEILEKEIAANQEAQDIFRELAANGVVNAKENLAFEKKKEAELALQKQKEIERAAKQELAFTAIQTYAGYVQGGEKGAQALASTVTDIAVLKQFISGLDFFFDGTENTGTVNNALDSNGGRLAVLHDNERVMTAEQNKMVSGLSNWELANLGADYKSGEHSVNEAIISQRFQSNAEIVSKFDSLENAINNIEAPNTSFHYDSIKNAMIKTVESGNKIERTINKKSKLF